MDRDGTISEEVGYINHPSRFRLFPFAAAAIKQLNENGWLAIVVTNQAGVARGYFPEEMIETVHADMTKQVDRRGALDSTRFTIARIIRPLASRRIASIATAASRSPV